MMKDLKTISYPCMSPSLLACDHQDVASEIRKAEEAGAPYIHIDVMDGKFVPATSFSVGFVNEISSIHSMINDTHIMVDDPLSSVKAFASSGSDIITFHLEACKSPKEAHKVIGLTHKMRVRSGISIKPSTPIEALYPFLNEVDLVLVMSVEPGKGGQEFIPESLGKIKALRAKIDELPFSRRPLIEVDGGINETTGKACIEAGADVLVAGSYLYGHGDFGARMEKALGK